MKNPPHFKCRHALAVISLTLTPLAMGQAPVNNYIWYNEDPEDGPLNGNWHIQPTGDPAPPPIWVLNGEPAVGVPDTLDDTASIANGATVTLDQTTIEVSQINVAGGGTSKLIVGGDNAYYTRQLRIGVNQVGTVDLNSGDLTLLDQGAVAGTLAPSVTIGQEGAGTGVLNQTGGTLNAEAVTSGGGHEDFRIGAFGGTGTYNLSGGESSMYNLRLGFAGSSPGVINHSGGTLNYKGGDFAISWAANAGVYNLSGTGVLSIPNDGRVRVGATANTVGIFNMTGGTATIAARFELGTEGDAPGGVPVANSGAKGTLNISGGTMTITNDILAGCFTANTQATGTINQTGGNLIVNRVRVGFDVGQIGHVNLNGGILTTNVIFKENAGSTATLSFNGGTIKATGGGNFIYGFPQVDILAGGMTIDTNNQGDTIVPPLFGPGGLTKKGAGFASLTALSNYEGNTVVEAGVLRLNVAGGLNPTSTVTIPSTGANLELAYAGSDTVAGLIVDGTPMPAGTYGALPGGGGVTGVSYITGTGTLIVSPPPAAGYTAWSEDPINNLAVGERAPTLDPDNDGFTNLTEYFLGGQPKVSSTAIAPVASLTATDINIAFNRSVASGGDTTAVIQWSTDLASWPPANQVAVSGTGAINQAISRTNAVNGKLFTRLKIVKP